MPLDYLTHIREESRRFRDVLVATDPAASVPSCPDWGAADLLWHLAEVQAFWGWVVETRASSPDGAPDTERPDSFDGLLAHFDASTRRLTEALRDAGPGEHVWTWAADHSVGFVLRRQAHEALIHRLDAELAAGEVTPLPAPLAADGVLEVLDVMYGGCPPWGAFAPGGTSLTVTCTDTGDVVGVALGRFTGTDPRNGTVYDEPDISVVTPAPRPDATVSGTADDLDAWLWHRRGPEGLNFSGDAGVLDAVRTILAGPIT